MTMKQKPSVCLLDEDKSVGIGWEQALGEDASLHYYQDHLELFNAASANKELIPSFSCIIVGRYFKHLGIDTVTSIIPDNLKAQGAQAIFLNWQGYVTKEEVNNKFDGKLFHRYGVKWQTLRLRVQKFEKVQKNTQCKKIISTPSHQIESVPQMKSQDKALKILINETSRPIKCSEILKEMARNAYGTHKEKIEHFAYQDTDNGIKLLEAIYDRLLADKNRPSSCPSQYINSSPVIAKRILKEALYG